MTATFIQTVELETSSSTIVVNSIPQDYDDLLVYVSGRNNQAGSNRGFIYPNGVSATLTETGLQGSGTGIGSITHQFVINYDDDTANAFSNCHTYIENYSSTTQAKAMHSMFANENNATQAYVGMASSLWDTTDAITSLEFHLNDGVFAARSKVSVYGIKRVAESSTPKATGGIISYDAEAGYYYHTFTSSGNFIPSETISTEYLVVAGGGGGGFSYSGGGGAGGYLASTATLSAQTYDVLIGAGGAGGPEGATGPSNGGNSSFNGTVAIGGGNGGQFSVKAAGNGGSGGGAGVQGTSVQSNGQGTAGQGFDGGTGAFDTTNEQRTGGGGGASEAGQNAQTTKSGDGGDGLQWLDGNYYAGGGGGGGRTTNSTSGAGGLGGGGDAGAANNPGGAAGTLSTGGGGGAGHDDRNGTSGIAGVGGNGGSGVVIIRYAA